MTYGEHIRKTLGNVRKSFKSINPGEWNSRHKSWEYCHEVFLKMHNRQKETKLNDEDCDYLALNLGFFLASWGMYRGSSFLLQMDYKVHIPVVKLIMNEEYDELWNFEPTEENKEKAKRLLFGEDGKGGLFEKIKELYSQNLPKRNNGVNVDAIEDGVETAKEERKPTNTLITKILLGTFAVIPAFDTFFKKACKQLTPKIKDKPYLAFIDLCDFAIRHREDLKGDGNYPVMKALDLYFWIVGFGLSLCSKRKDEKKKEKALENLLFGKHFEIKTETSNGMEEAISFSKNERWR